MNRHLQRLARVLHIDPRYTHLVDPLLAEDTPAHLCDHQRNASGDTQGCPNWPTCLTPGVGLLRPAAPVTDDEAVAFAVRWREAMAAGRISDAGRGERQWLR